MNTRTSDLHIKRQKYSALSTLGKLFFKGDFFSYTLENTIRGPGIKLPGFTGLPAGWYKVKLDYSSRFKKVLPLVYTRNDSSIYINDIRFDDVCFHGGHNHLDTDTDGSILVAQKFINSDTLITVDDETKSVKDFYVWESMSEKLCSILEKGKIYNLLIEN